MSNVRHAFLIGAAKTGSTALATSLDSHPDICLADTKEPVFFEAEYERGLPFYWDKYFAPRWKGEQLALDARILHFPLPFVAERIRASYPEAPLVVLLRNPTDRAFSWWLHRHQRWSGIVPVADFEQEIEIDQARLAAGEDFTGPDAPERWRRHLVLAQGKRAHDVPLILDLGLYAQQLERWQAVFPKGQFSVLFTEDLTYPETVPKLLEFLGVEPTVELVDGERNGPWRQSAHRPGALGVATRLVQRSGLHRAVPGRLRDRLRERTTDSAPPPEFPDHLRARLDEFYAPHNRRLAELLERRLPASWAS